MKRKLLIRCMTAMAILLTPACTNDFGLEGIASSEVDSEEVEVTFTISAEGAQALTRANEVEGGGPGQWQTTIGKGTKIDMLVYAVYNEKYERLDQYGSTEIPESLKNCKALEGSTHDGQKIEYVGGILNEGKSKEITLRLMRNKTYRIAFWAQSSETTAFNTSNLENVKVIYENAENNDELRDAFCKVETFTVTPSTSSRTVVLTRPMAQINVGTTGADYKNVVKEKHKKIAYSRITLWGVAQYINVVEDKIDEENLLNTDINEDGLTFNRAILPAFINNEGTTDVGRIPTEVNELIGSDANNNASGEEFLYVDLDNDGVIKGYKTNYPTLLAEGEKDKPGYFLTETFKYLSMCYVLVPATTVSEKGGVAGAAEGSTESSQEATYTSYVLPKLAFGFAEKDAGKEAFPTISVTQVPVHRNWRTNLLGGLRWMKDPTNPEDPGDDPEPPTDPDDPTTVFQSPSLYVYLDPIYDGEYTTEDQGGSWIENPDQSDKVSGDADAPSTDSNNE